MKIGLVFGSRNTEHDVSIVTARVVANALNEGGYGIVLFYITRDGKWYLNENWNIFEGFDGSDLSGWRECSFSSSTLGQPVLVKDENDWVSYGEKIDCFFPTVHGMYGEDGTLQGVFEMANVPYTGANVLGAALGLDKVVQKNVLKSFGVPMVKYTSFTQEVYDNDSSALLEQIKNNFSLPIFIKPARLGSSIGITKVKDIDSLKFAIELALQFDTKILVEQGVDNPKEINVALLGNNKPMVSKTEEPLSAEDFLTFQEKYISGGGTIKQAVADKVKVPADIPAEVEKEILEISEVIYRELEGRGISRIDFLYDRNTQQFYFNEINSFPGTMQVGLWKKSGFEPSEVAKVLVDSAMELWKQKNSLKKVFKSSILKQSGGVKKY